MGTLETFYVLSVSMQARQIILHDDHGQRVLAYSYLLGSVTR